MPEQNSLPGIRVSNHSNLGVNLEKEMEAVHEWYRLKRIADIKNVPRSWSFISANEYQKQQGKSFPKMLARTDDGKYMIRVKSDLDFAGGGRNFSIAFDCKETSANRFPLGNVEPHQLLKMRDRAKCGIISGIMLKFTKYNRLFYVHFDFLNRRIEEMEKQKLGRRAKPGTASLTLADCESSAVEIKPDKINGLWDYLPQLLSIFGGKI